MHAYSRNIKEQEFIYFFDEKMRIYRHGDHNLILQNMEKKSLLVHNCLVYRFFVPKSLTIQFWFYNYLECSILVPFFFFGKQKISLFRSRTSHVPVKTARFRARRWCGRYLLRKKLFFLQLRNYFPALLTFLKMDIYCDSQRPTLVTSFEMLNFNRNMACT